MYSAIHQKALIKSVQPAKKGSRLIVQIPDVCVEASKSVQMEKPACLKNARVVVYCSLTVLPAIPVQMESK